ncbi:hypothetical protein [Melghirimyces algeriensis]|uniref:hypothetical protein n=1 Tax=Melghirimyces algeriensis TaxID=910412 RepID=UPI001157F546|nr:hypothetical protein [Melghirimyces algeriensis]
MSNEKSKVDVQAEKKDRTDEGRDSYWMDVDRMINEGLGGGNVGQWSGLIEESRPLEQEEPPQRTNDL